MGDLGHDSFWDFNHDGKLSGAERAMRDQEIISGFEASRNIGKYKGSGSSYRNNDFNKNSIGDNVMAFFGAAFIAFVCFFIGAKMIKFEGEFTQTTSAVLIIAGIVFGIFACYFVVNIIEILLSKKK